MTLKIECLLNSTALSHQFELKGSLVKAVKLHCYKKSIVQVIKVLSIDFLRIILNDYPSGRRTCQS